VAKLPRTVADCCDLCGSVAADGDTMHFAMGKLWCMECFSGQRPAVSKPPTKSQQQALLDWIQPQRRKDIP
jgi:hypothetical protein